MSTLNFGDYVVSFPWAGRQTPVHYPSGYYFIVQYDDELGVTGFHFDSASDPSITGYVAPSTYQAIESATDIAGAASGPLLAAPLPPGIGLVKIKPPT